MITENSKKLLKSSNAYCQVFKLSEDVRQQMSAIVSELRKNAIYAEADYTIDYMQRKLEALLSDNLDKTVRYSYEARIEIGLKRLFDEYTMLSRKQKKAVKALQKQFNEYRKGKSL